MDRKPLDAIKERRKIRICENCRFFYQKDAVLGCEYTGKLILADYIPHKNEDNPCKNFAPKVGF